MAVSLSRITKLVSRVGSFSWRSRSSLSGTWTTCFRSFCVGMSEYDVESDKKRMRQRELDKLGAWNSGAKLPELKEESSFRHGTLIPKVTIDHIGICHHQGRRSYQQDRYLISDKIGEDLGLDLRLLAVFDGHGGAECSQFCAENLERFIIRHISAQFESIDKEFDEDVYKKKVDMTLALNGAIKELNDSFARFWETSKDSRCQLDHAFARDKSASPGTTATIALIRDGYELVVAQVGDSRAPASTR